MKLLNLLLLSKNLLSTRYFHSQVVAMSSSSSDIVKSSKNHVKVGIVQMSVDPIDKEVNIKNAEKHINDVVSLGSELIVLPEVWNSPYAAASFPPYAEYIPSIGISHEDIDSNQSPSTKMLGEMAMKHNIWLIGGSIPEKAMINNDEKIFNTCPIFNSKGELVAKHRKVHLFDIDVKEPQPMYFKESETLTAGDDYTIIETPWGKVGIGICYDIRFPEFALNMRKMGVKMLCYPGAFNMVTGPAHWELLARTRAVDNQVFTILCSPARVVPEEKDSKRYVAYGHSLVCDPWGEIKLDADINVCTKMVELDLSRLDEVRGSVPYWEQKRHDLYHLS